MPKLKTHKGAQRRFKVTGSGKLMYSKIGKSHFRRRKPPRVKRAYNGMLVSSPANEKRIKQLLPNR